MSKIDIGKLIDVGAVIAKTLQEQAAKKSTDMTATDVPKVEPAVTRAVENAVAPIIENVTNNEPWYKSRILRGAALAICSTAYLAFTDWNADGVVTHEALGGYVSAIASGLFVIYGRLTNRAAPAL